MSERPWSRIFLRAFVASIVVNAVLGIAALVSGDFGSTEERILATSFLVSATMLTVLVNLPAARRRAAWPAPVIAPVAGTIGFVLLIVLVWAEPGSENWFKVAGSSLVVAAAGTLIANLALVTTGSGRGLGAVASVVISVAAITVLAGIWTEPEADWYARLLGVEGVLVAAITLLIPVLARYGPRRPPIEGADVGAGPALRFCPSCGRSLPDATEIGATVVCATCGSSFDVVFGGEAPRPGS